MTYAVMIPMVIPTKIEPKKIANKLERAFQNIPSPDSPRRARVVLSKEKEEEDKQKMRIRTIWKLTYLSKVKKTKTYLKIVSFFSVDFLILGERRIYF